MEHIFVWTFKDVMGLDVMGLVLFGSFLIIVLVIWIAATFQDWLASRRRQKKDGQT